MNKNLFRIIFNKRRGQLMAVAETSSSQGKGSRGESTASDHPAIADSATVEVGILSFAVLCSLGAVLWALPMPSAYAQVVAYRNAPGSQQPSVLKTANGVPQVNIQTPSSAGLSHNVYNQFDVQSNGVILNNSKDNVNTQLGGWVQGNPWLATGSARVILNEVNSSTPSYLNGSVEVAGQRAEVVIANPSGISVNGGGFINTNKVTLTTGTPIVNGGSLDGYRVQGGNISINGNGLDLSDTDYAAILARAVQVNAGIWAKELKVVTGANQIDAASLAANTTPVTTTIAGTGAVPSFALDVAQIGGMYAGKIHLIGTEQGLGVRSAGTIGSMVGDLVLQNTGWLSNTGELQASANLQITAQGNISNSGTLYASNDQTLIATGSASNSGVIAAQGNTSITVNNLSSTSASVVGAGIKTDGTLASSGNLSIATTESLSANGKNLAAGDITTTGSSVDFKGSLTSAKNVEITAAGNLSTANATVVASQNLTVFSADFNNVGGTLSASHAANFQSNALNNDAGLIQVGGDLVINTHGNTLTNTNAANYISSNAAINGKGGIAAQGTNTLTTGSLNNDAGYIGSKGLLTAMTASISNKSGQIQGLDNLTLTAGNGSTTGKINNTGGLIRSAAVVSVNAGEVLNSNTSASNQGLEGQDIGIATAKLNNNTGAIRANNDVSITSAGSVDNTSGLISAGNALTLQDTQIQSNRVLAITNKEGTLIADKTLTVAANSLSGDGKALSRDDLGITLNTDFNNSGQVIANHNATINTAGNVSNSGKLQAGNTLDLAANNIDNTVTGEISANTPRVNANSTLTNRGLIDGVDMQVNANTVNNIGAGRIYGDHLSIAAFNLTNDTETIADVTKAGTLAARDRLDLGIGGTLTNREHALIYSVGGMAMGGALDANRQATGSVTTLNNNSAKIEAGRNLSLSSSTINNTNDHFEYEIRAANVELDVSEVINSDLYRIFTRTTYLPYQTASDPAQILAGGDINLNSSKVTNYASHILAGGALKIGSSTLANTDVMATKSIRDVGTTYTLVHVPGSGICGKISINCVHASDDWQTGPYDSTTESRVVVAQVTAASHSGAQIDVRTQAAVSDGASGARAVNAAHAVNARNGVVSPITLPTSSLFKNNPSSTSSYLIETDTRFIDRKLWLGSDYMTQSLSLDPTVTQKRLGDGFYEQKLIREQVAELTGRRFLADYTSDEQEYKALMTSAITFGQKYNLRPGIALTAQQVAQLTSDIVWLVEQTVRLPDGSSQKVLIPQVYVKVQSGDLDGSGALLAGKDVNINLSGDLTNSGTIAGRRVVDLTADNVNNLGGRIGGNDVSVAARQDLNNIGGSIGATNSLSATAGRDLNIQTTTQSTNTQVGSANFSRTGVDRVAGLYVSGANGTLVASAGRDLNIVAGVVSNAGSGATSLSAGNNFTLATVKTGEQNSITWDADNHLNYGSTQTVGSTINGGGNVNLKAGNDLTVTAANVQATEALTAKAGGSVNILAGENTTNLDEAHKNTHRGFFGRSTATTKKANNTSSVVGSELNGDSISISAGGNVSVKASGLSAASTVAINATKDISVESGRNTQSIKPTEFEIQKSHVNGGAVLLSAGNDLTLTTTEIHGTGIANSSNPSTALIAGGDLKISSEQISRKTVVGGATTQSLVTDRSSIFGENGLVLYGGKSIDASAVDLNSANGGVSVVSKGDITLGYNTDTVQKNWTTSSSSRSWYGKTTTTVTQHETIDKTASTTALNGQSIEVLGQNVLSEGAQIGAANAIRVEGVDQTLLYAVQNQSIKTENSQRSSSWFGIGLGSKDQTDTNFKSQSLGTRLESQQAIQIGVGAKADLRGADLQAPVIAFTRATGADTSKTGELILGGSTNTTQSSHTETTKTAGVWQKQAGNGSTEQTLTQTQLKGQTTFAPSLNISVQIPEGNLKTQIQTLSSQPGLAYINDLAKRNDINWNQVSLVHDQWSYSQQGLTPAGAALLTIAVMVATGGMGAELAGTASTATTAGVATTTTTMAGTTLATTVGTTTTFTAAGAAMNAGFSALAAQASVSLANNGGDIGKTLKDLGSSSTVKNTLVAMATAGVGTSVAGQGVSAVAAQTAAGCATGAATGAGCEQGAKTAAVLSTAGETYQSLVGYAANAGPGENRNGTRLDGNSTGNATYEPVDRPGPNFGQQQPIDRGMNVIGLNVQGSVLSQGSAVSRAFNEVPFINATAGLHDYFFNANQDLSFKLWNVPSMAPAAALSIAAALNNPNISWITQVKQPESVKQPMVPSVIRIDTNTTTQNAVSIGGSK